MNTTGNKYGGRTKGTPNKLTSKIKDKLSSVISEAIDSLDLETMSKAEKLKLIQLGLPYIITKPQIEEPQQEQQMFQIEIIDSLSKN
jgi:lantibiotic modifying enzyme